ncbi:MAG: DoxX family protein [Opitutales bacterium]
MSETNTSSAITPPPLNFALGYLLLRLATGVNFLMHGAVRIFGDLGGFAEYIKGEFAGKLPEFLLVPYAYALTFAELILGAMVLLGFRSREALVGLGLVLSTLILGSCLNAMWSAVHSQMLHTLVVAFLLYRIADDRFSVDRCVFGR